MININVNNNKTFKIISNILQKYNINKLKYVINQVSNQNHKKLHIFFKYFINKNQNK